MAKGIDFEERNDVLGKPPSTTDNQVYGLPICRLVTHIPGEKEEDPPTQTPAHVSCWELSDEEVEEIVRTRKVWLRVIGYTTYPLAIYGKKPIYPEGTLADKVYSKEEIEQWKKEAEERRQQKEN